MDNFEYSIQINDRDWEEFYSTAEECGLMQVSLATEELWLSDSEQEDTTKCTLSNKSKLIRISLCPPPKEECPTLMPSEPRPSQFVQTSNRWLDPNEDILSGSEDEEEFGSVSRFLCQKEQMHQKKESEVRIDIPLSVDHSVINPNKEHLRINLAGEGLVEYMRTLNHDRHDTYQEDSQQHMDKTSMERINETQVDLGLPVIEPTGPVQLDDNPSHNDNSTDHNNLPYCAHMTESSSSVIDHVQDINIPDVHRSEDETISNMLPSRQEATLSECLSKDNDLHMEDQMFDGQKSLEEPISSKLNGLVYYTMEYDTPDNSCEVAPEISVNSSAVEQNVPTSTMKELHIFPSDSINYEVMATSNTHDPADHSTITHSLLPDNTTVRAWRNVFPPAETMNTVLTLPEMYDFFFDDVSDTVFLEAESNMASQDGTEYTKQMQDVPTSTIEELSESPNYEVTPTANTHNSVDHTPSAHSQVPVHTTIRAWRNPTPLSQPSSSSYMKAHLTLPEMYDFFFDDVSNTVFDKTESNMESKEGIVYTPEMYEYFFLEDEEQKKAKSQDSNTSQETSTDLALASSSSVIASWPEACEFFFADGPQFGNREGIIVRVPSSQAQSAADFIQSLVPEGLKGYTVRRARHQRGLTGSVIPQDPHSTSEESNVSISGSIAPCLSPSRRNACLVFLAFASWAVKSSDLQSSEGWKTALLANIGAVSAIQYLRRRSRRTWRESPPESGDET
ncbi:PGC-1 and ERR-induced regulator in muscle protein 1 isoform X1 [Engystomops pustulosus]|uniref:PGC-1 and ERR-induced regulator in muscle protein 1 isoform X1 n=1 Tax=Engystomops pustulosus TaxID=76066 RepID=UPI003AFA7276